MGALIEPGIKTRSVYQVKHIQSEICGTEMRIKIARAFESYPGDQDCSPIRVIIRQNWTARPISSQWSEQAQLSHTSESESGSNPAYLATAKFFV